MGKFKVVSDLLSDVSIAKRNEGMEIVWIPRAKIEKNKRNGYKVRDVAALAADIRKNGLGTPLEVRQSESGYVLISGERRLTAIDELIRSGDWKLDIPCFVKKLGDYNVNLSDASKEMYAILRTNCLTRKDSDADLYFEAVEWSKIIQEAKKNGESLLLVDGDENPTELQLQGRTREIVARELQISNGQVGKITYIEKNAIPEVKEAILKEQMKIAAAFCLASMSEEEQREFMSLHEGVNIDAQDVADFQTKMSKKVVPVAMSTEAPTAAQVSEAAETPAAAQVSEAAEAPTAAQVSESAEAQATAQVSEPAEAPAAAQVGEPAETPAAAQASEPEEAPAITRELVIGLIEETKQEIIQLQTGHMQQGHAKELARKEAIAEGLELLLAKIKGRV